MGWWVVIEVIEKGEYAAALAKQAASGRTRLMSMALAVDQ